MAKALRVDEATRTGDAFSFSYTYGDAPLPEAASGQGTEISATSLNTLLADVQGALNPTEMLTLAIWSHLVGGDFALANIGTLVGKQITFDLGNSTPKLTIG